MSTIVNIEKTTPRFRTKNGWVQLELPEGSSPLTLELTRQWENEDAEEEYRRALSPRR